VTRPVSTTEVMTAVMREDRLRMLEQENTELRTTLARVLDLATEAFLANEPIRPERLRDVLNER
jgi:hypothetical protein